MSKVANIKLVVAIALVLVMVAALACGSKDEAPGAKPAGEQPAAPAAGPADGVPFVPAAGLSPTGTKKGTWEPVRQQPGVVFMPSLYDGPTPTSWQQNPRFAQMIQNNEPYTYGNHQGVLLPLEERVPVVEDRLIEQPPDEIGEYGGTWRMANSGWMIDHATMNIAGVVKWGADGVTNTPYVMKDAVTSFDGRTHVFTLRRGLKYSDGELLDIENIRFAHEAIDFSPEKYSKPVIPCKDAVTGNWCKFKVIDELHWSYTFDTPNYVLLEGEAGSRLMQYCRTWCVYASDYVKQFVPGYADPKTLQAQIEELDLENWVAHLQTKLSVHGIYQRLQPQVGPWIQTGGLSVGSSLSSTSNPYYHVFDPEGNQLPYLDGVESIGYESRAVAVFRALAGESDGHTQIYRTEELPLYQSNLVTGDFSLYPWPDSAGTDSVLSFNQTYNKDPEIGRMMRQKDFRIALSLATDRKAINELVFMGLGTPQNPIPHVSTPFFPGEEYMTLDTGHDIDRANALLEELGYVDTDGDGFRNRIGDLTGDPGNIKLFIGLVDDRFQTAVQVLMPQWAKVGVLLDFKINAQADLAVRNNILYFSLGGGHGNPNPFSGGSLMYPGSSAASTGPLIGRFFETEGKEGMGPTGPDRSYLPLAPEGTFPADSSGKITSFREILESGKGFPMDHPTRIKAGKEYFALGAQEKYAMGFVSFAPAFRGIMLKRNNFRNVQKHHNWDAIGFFAELYYFEGGTDNIHNPDNRSQRYESESFLSGLTYN